MKNSYLKFALISLLGLNASFANDERYRAECDVGVVESSLAVKTSLTFIWPTQKRGEIKGAVASCSCVRKVEWLPDSELTLQPSGGFKTEIILDTSQFEDGQKVEKEIIFTVEDSKIYYVHVKVNFSVIDTYTVPPMVVLGEADLGSTHPMETQLLGGIEVIKKDPNIKIAHYNPKSGLFKVVINSSIASNLPWVGTLHLKGKKSEHKINFFVLKKKKTIK